MIIKSKVIKSGDEMPDNIVIIHTQSILKMVDGMPKEALRIWYRMAWFNDWFHKEMDGNRNPCMARDIFD
jgi:hypothetical protein